MTSASRQWKLHERQFTKPQGLTLRPYIGRNPEGLSEEVSTTQYAGWSLLLHSFQGTCYLAGGRVRRHRKRQGFDPKSRQLPEPSGPNEHIKLGECTIPVLIQSRFKGHVVLEEKPASRSNGTWEFAPV